MLVQMSPGILNFAERYGIAINDPDLIRRYRLEIDWIRDEKTRIAVAENRGLEKGREEGFEKAVDECIKEGYLAEILKKSRAEVHKVCLYEFDQEKHDKITFNDGYKNGEIAGYKNGEIAEKRKTVERMLSKGYTKEQIMDITGYENELINSIIQ